MPYLNAEVKLTFDKEMAAESFAGISVVDKSGNKSALDGAYVYETDASGAMTKSEYTAPLGELKPNTEYYLDLGNIKTLMGGESAGGPVEFRTEKSPFCIDGVSYSASGGILTVKVNLRNASGETQTAALTAGAYGALAMYAVGAKSISTGADASYTFTMAEPKDSYTVEVYLFDDMSSLRLIDKAVAE